MTDEWRTLDFRPAEKGWYAVYIYEGEDGTPGDYSKTPLAGWLIQEAPNGERRVVAADYGGDDGLVHEVEGGFQTSFLCVLGPGEPPPDRESVARQFRFRMQLRDRAFELEIERENEEYRVRKVAA